MPQFLATVCSHNAVNQTLLPVVLRPEFCRQCGAVLEPEERAVNAANQVAAGVSGSSPTAFPTNGIFANYPGKGPT